MNDSKFSDHEWEEFEVDSAFRYLINVQTLLPLALPQAFLIDDAVPRNCLTFIAGPPGGAKSWVAYSLALSVARGEDWLGRECCVPSGNVMVLNYDNPTSLMAQRFSQLGATANDPIYFLTRPREDPTWAAPLFDDNEHRGGRDRLRAMVSRLRPTLVLVDTFRKAQRGDENDSAKISASIDNIKCLLAYDETTIVVIHHTTKSSNTLRGSGEIEASADAIIQVTSVDDEENGEVVRTCKWIKHRGWDMPASRQEIQFALVDRVVGGCRQTRVVI